MRQNIAPGPYSVRRRDPFQAITATFRSLAPYAILWAAVYLVVRWVVDQPTCVGVCAVYAGSISYVLIIGAVAVTIAVAAAQILLSW